MSQQPNRTARPPSRTQMKRINDSRQAYAAPAAITPMLDLSAGSTVQNLFHQLTQALTVLDGAADLLLEGKGKDVAAQALHMWLQPSARQAEAIMHELRELRLSQFPAATELSQCLTVLVLAADMIANGQLADDQALSSYALLRRNADRAMRGLCDLRAQISSGVQRGEWG